jgi:hypothetical protein
VDTAPAKNRAVIIARAVLESAELSDFELWPVADLPAYRLTPISGDLSPAEVGTAVATIADYNDTEYMPNADARELLQRTIDAECMLAQGGLRLHGPATGVTVDPGCCCGLESWRDWLDLVDGTVPWLGHDPSPRVELRDGIAHVWPTAHGGTPIEPRVADVPGLLAQAQQQLQGFLQVVMAWATPFGEEVAAGLVDALDQHLDITRPLSPA